MFRRMKRCTQSLMLVTAGTALLMLTAASTAQTTPGTTVSPRLVGAKTIQVTQKLYVTDKPGHRALERILRITVERPANIRIEQTMLHDYSPGGELPGSSVFILTDTNGLPTRKIPIRLALSSTLPVFNAHRAW